MKNELRPTNLVGHVFMRNWNHENILVVLVVDVKDDANTDGISVKLASLSARVAITWIVEYSQFLSKYVPCTCEFP